MTKFAHLSNLDSEAEFTAALDQFLVEKTPSNPES